MNVDSPVLVWFRNDLRIADNPALDAAVKHGSVIPVYIHSPQEDGLWAPGGASKWWLHHSLTQLSECLTELGSKLIIREGNAIDELTSLLEETEANAVFWNRRYEPAIIARDTQIKEHLRREGIEVGSFNSHLLFEPWTVQNKSGKPFQVFTPFWKSCLANASTDKLCDTAPTPRKLEGPVKWPRSLKVSDLQLKPKLNWADGFGEIWEPGETGAHKQLKQFLTETIFNYSESRNFPSQVGTSRLSPHLHFGEISPGQIFAAIKAAAEKKSVPEKAWRHWQFVTELGWREFAHHLLFHFPQTPEEPLRAEFKRFPWHTDTEALKAWQRGQTGYPIVDAGMRELWHTGWMHNRVRMIAASFLVKDLLLPWQEGAKWFWDTLVDADLANNTLGWQWSAGCGADAAPFFRIFNPVTQGEQFDPKGEYVRRWIPEIARLPDRWLHAPWQAPAEVLKSSGIKFGKSYPEPIVQHGIAREVALEAFQKLKKF